MSQSQAFSIFQVAHQGGKKQISHLKINFLFSVGSATTKVVFEFFVCFIIIIIIIIIIFSGTGTSQAQLAHLAT